MKTFKPIARIMIFVLIFSALTIAPTQAVQAHVGKSVVYNLYATDGFIELADGSSVYNYGFIGGREGVEFTYETSFCTGDGTSRTCSTPTNVTLDESPAPSGGPWEGLDSQLAGNAQFPAPLIYSSVGDVVEIRLKNLGVAANPNAPNDPHSIHLHGLDVNAANDGVPETSVGAVPANLCADGSYATRDAPCETPAPGAGNVIVYMYTSKVAGSAMYHCHQEADIHVNMGMYGANITYNPTDPAAQTGPGMGKGGNLWGFPYDKDYVLLMSEMDIRGHADEEGAYGGLVPITSRDPNPFNWANYEPQYWFLNGLSFPQTIHAGFPSGYTFDQWVAAHKGYDPLIVGKVSGGTHPAGDWRTPGEKVLIRMINMGFETQPMHMHGYHGKIIGSDQRVWDWSNTPGVSAFRLSRPPTAFGQGLEKNTLTIGSGETYEWLVDFGQQSFQSAYASGTMSCYDPDTGLPIENATGCTPIVEPNQTGNYIAGPTVTGIDGTTPNFDFAGYGSSQYFPFHNHDDYKATNNGVYPGGMFTMLVPTP